MWSESGGQSPRQLLQSLFEVAVQRAQAAGCLSGQLPAPPDPSKGRTVVIGAGKAAAAMAQAVEAVWPQDAPLSGVVVTRYDHVPPRSDSKPARIQVLEASHPVPDAASMAGSQAVLAAVQGLGPDDLVLCLMSGGASSLLCLPTPGLSLEQKQAIHRQLLLSGAPIDQMNIVRKHLSAIKGGRLAAACGPARVVTLAISDVPGDDLAVIGSGPTVPDASTSDDALSILRHYRIDLPPEIHAALSRGELETAKPSHPSFGRHQARVVARPWASLQAAAEWAHAQGLAAHVLGDEFEGESSDCGRMHAALARSVAQHGQPFSRPCVLLSGGETTVTVRPLPSGQSLGRGGRAGEFCLGLAQGLRGHPGIWGLAADTDGIDGVETNAGAWVTPDTLARAQAAKLSVGDALLRHDAYGFFDALGDLLVSGPTFTNVNDFRAVLVL